MTFLNSQQLAFLLDIKKEDARAKMCNAWEKEKGIKKNSNANGFESVHGAEWNHKNKIVDNYPQAMQVELLERQLNIPHLQVMIDDIKNNYLKRAASKKFILYDYPEKKLLEAHRDSKPWPIKLDVPPALRSMLPKETIEEIGKYWQATFTYKHKDTGEILPKILIKA